MGRKGAKRKTRWRTLSIGTPPGEEDEEEGVRNGYVKSNNTEHRHHNRDHQYKERNGYAPWLKSRHGSAGSSSNGSGGSNGSSSGYGSSRPSTRQYRDNTTNNNDQQSSTCSSNQKVAFNEDEYTKITTPRQDMLFKKGYLSQRKPWIGTTSMSATPSTTESQSASHSTAGRDGSEAAEDQQLLDSGVVGEYAGPLLEPAPLSYGTYYDHASGYYYEYPMMLVGPALPPDQMGANIITAMPCAPVPLRPIEWVNPAFVPKLASEQYCYMDYQGTQGPDCAAVVDAQGVPIEIVEPVPTQNGVSHEASLTGSDPVSASVSVNGSVHDEPVVYGESCTEIQPQIVDEQQIYQTQDYRVLEDPQTDYQVIEDPTVTQEYQGIEDPNVPQEYQVIEDPNVPQEYQVIEDHNVPQDYPVLEDPNVPQEYQVLEDPNIPQEYQVLEDPTVSQEYQVLADPQQLIEEQQQQIKDLHIESMEQPAEMMEPLEYAETPYVETLPPQPVHLHTHCIPQAIPQSYIYPGQYMFGPPVVNLNGVTIQSGHMLRCNDMLANSAVTACAKRRRKKKRRQRQRLGNMVDDDEEDYSSDGENGSCSSRVTWSATTTSSSQRPLNPESKEFKRPLNPESPEFQQTLNPECPEFQRPLNPESPEFQQPLNPESPEFQRPLNPESPEFQSPLNPESSEFHRPLNPESPEFQKPLNPESPEFQRALNPECPEFPRPLNPECQEFKLRSTVESKIVPEQNYSNSNGNEEFTIMNGQKESTTDCNDSNALELKNHADNDTKRLTDDVKGEDTSACDINSKDSQEKLTNGNHSLENGIAEHNFPTKTPSRRKLSGKSLKLVREPTPGPDLDNLDTTNIDDSSIMPNQDNTTPDLSIKEVTTMLSTTSIVEAQASLKDGDLDICQTWVNESSITSESCNETTTTPTKMTTMMTTTTTKDEDSGFESQSTKTTDRPITFAVTKWLKRANSPDLFITSSAASEDDEDGDEDDASVSNEPSKNLQGNPMPALSVNAATNDGSTDVPRKFASSSGLKKTYISKTSTGKKKKKNRNARSAKRKGAKVYRRNSNDLAVKVLRDDDYAEAQETTLISIGDISRIDGTCELTEKDSDAGMRVAEKARIITRDPKDSTDSSDDTSDTRICRIPKDTCDLHKQPVKTFEKGEIVVSMDGELLLVSSTIQESPKLKDSSDENSSTPRRLSSGTFTVEDDNERSLGISIEEPDVLECWEAETFEPLVTPKRIIDTTVADLPYDDSLMLDVNDKSDRFEQVKQYYKLQVDSSVTSIDTLDATNRTIVPKPGEEEEEEETTESTTSSSDEEILVIVPEEKIASISTTNDDSRLPIDEAFEVYESCYTGGKPLPYTNIDPKTRLLYGRDEEGPIPCKAVCCNIQ